MKSVVVDIQQDSQWKEYWVYALCDPRDEITRYVGVTYNPRTRLLNHFKPSPKNPKLTEWVQSLLREGVRPAMRILGKVTPYCHSGAMMAYAVEKRLIHCFDGKLLLNIAKTKRELPAPAGKRSREYRRTVGRSR